MGDKEARALGSGDRIEVNGEIIVLSPLQIGVLQEIQRECLRCYKRQILETYQDVRSSLKEGVYEQKVDEVSRWDVSKLPNKTAYSCKSVPITESVVDRLCEIYGKAAVQKQKERTADLQQMLAAALDNEKVTSDEVKKLTGVRPEVGVVPYDIWWVTAVYEGMILFVHQSAQIKQPSITRKEVASWPLDALVRAARVTEHLTAPAVGNM